MCFSGPDVPPPVVMAPPPPPPSTAAPEEADKAVRAAQSDEQKQARLRKGRASTLLTGAQGVMGQANVQKKSLLGL